MIISCPNCGKKYSVEDNKLTPNKKLRCTSCKNIWEYIPDYSEEDIDAFFVKDENSDNSDNSENESNIDNTQQKTIIEKKEIEQEKVAEKNPPKNSEKKQQVKQNKKSNWKIICIIILVKITFGLGWYFKDYILNSLNSISYVSALSQKMVGFLAKRDENMPSFENVNIKFESDDIVKITGELVNNSKFKTDCRFLVIKVTPDIKSVFSLLISNPGEIFSFLDNFYVKLEKSVLLPNEKVGFSANVKVAIKKSNLIKILPSNLQ